ncbi:hypothetical protein R1flu_005088 [Riccia fluitans]|uniref:Uncharacterized protein n=1 Tax=Riccia fluitans TaxID=41844 RepID=A0ABD1YUY9_9MARC
MQRRARRQGSRKLRANFYRHSHALLDFPIVRLPGTAGGYMKLLTWDPQVLRTFSTRLTLALEPQIQETT